MPLETSPEQQLASDTAAEGFAMIKPDSKGALALIDAMNAAKGNAAAL